jgi:hypothetical protein
MVVDASITEQAYSSRTAIDIGHRPSIGHHLSKEADF